MPLFSDPRANTALKLCPHCDAAYRRSRVGPGMRAYCERCGTELYRNADSRYQALLPVVLASLITFVVSNAFPIVAMEIQGLRTETTVWGAVRVLSMEDMLSVSMLVFVTTMLFPLIELGLLAYLLVPLRMGRVPSGFGLVIRLVRLGRPWGMIEVFMLGIVASLVKLSAMATVLPGVALWSFGCLTVLLAVVVSFDPAELWEYAERIEAGQDGMAAEPSQ
ncbi:Inner membrane protein YebS [Pigmentiphaga humi]|uniref:Inner membrane protein YebS n=1 Tax=Pigmentiphaga humi TaxID=2478468 RepID=A0A3P4AXR6_9BURK|nr:paraquat-inducible protein A [Pigmentiphaga humi]VCU68572.1 Inner membrane protein YebS [Pigmentiphaga humi]